MKRRTFLTGTFGGLVSQLGSRFALAQASNPWRRTAVVVGVNRAQQPAETVGCGFWSETDRGLASKQKFDEVKLGGEVRAQAITGGRKLLGELQAYRA